MKTYRITVTLQDGTVRRYRRRHADALEAAQAALRSWATCGSGSRCSVGVELVNAELRATP